MARFLLLLGVVVAVYFLMRWATRQPAKAQWQMVAVLIALVLLVLVLTGRAHWLTAVFAAILPFVRGLMTFLLGNMSLLKRLMDSARASKSRQPPSGGQTSTVQSHYIRMTLDHDSGDVSGEVLAGSFKGRRLDQLDLDALLRLLEECREDDESVSLLQVYLDRNYADSWRQQAGAEGQRQAANESGEMTRAEALQILGLPSDASEADIVDAHRRLMQKLHPDRGGSAYLAAKINLAKETLLG